MKDIIKFLQQLRENNNREWFMEHKQQYLDAKAQFEEITLQLIAGCAQFDPRIKNLTVKDCTYRIYRDVRFSQDKSPYKVHMGAYVCPKGKKSGYAGYYFHIGTGGEGYPYGHMLAAGDYRFQPEVLKVLREDIIADNGELDRIIKTKVSPLFEVDKESALKRVPNGFPADSPWAEYLKLKTFCLCYAPDMKFMTSKDAVERSLELFSTTQPFLEYINRAIEYCKQGF
ncbi:MAG: DUF2461 domain-containing protein [Prevotellaceae bacterium]|nr:DUF2461 domain-containing protein [Prevotellaceae bacterium]